MAPPAGLRRRRQDRPAHLRMSRAAKTAPPMVWSAAWLSGRPTACCMAAIDSTAAVGLSTMTE
eukprot:14105934-Alexandrium_andersonii.AAC.1